MKKLIGLLALISVVLLTVGCPQPDTPETPTLATYTVTFAAGEGASGTMEAQTFTEGVAKDLPLNTFTPQANKVFAYWQTSSGVQYADGALFEATASITLTAVWSDSVTVTFNANGGTGDVYVQTFTPGVTEALTLNGYTAPEGKGFAGWMRTTTGSSAHYANGEDFTTTESITLHALWNDTYTVNFNANGGSGTMQSQTFTVDVPQALTLNTFTAPTGNSSPFFSGWATSSTATTPTYVNGGIYTSSSSGNKTLYAVWTHRTLVKAELSSDETILTVTPSEAAAGTSTFKTAIHSVLTDSNRHSIITINIVQPTDESKIIPEDDLSELFGGEYSSDTFRALTTITGLQYVDTTNVTNMESMFASCWSLTSLDLSAFNTPNVTNMSRMFQDLRSITSLDLSAFDTKNVTTMERMFYSSESLTELDLSSFDTTNVTNMERMFSGCNEITEADGKTQADCAKFNASSNKASNVNFVVKTP